MKIIPMFMLLIGSAAFAGFTIMAVIKSLQEQRRRHPIAGVLNIITILACIVLLVCPELSNKIWGAIKQSTILTYAFYAIVGLFMIWQAFTILDAISESKNR